MISTVEYDRGARFYLVEIEGDKGENVVHFRRFVNNIEDDSDFYEDDAFEDFTPDTARELGEALIKAANESEKRTTQST